VDGVGEGRRREDEEAAGRIVGLLVGGGFDFLSGDLDRFTSFTPGLSLRALISL